MVTTGTNVALTVMATKEPMTSGVAVLVESMLGSDVGLLLPLGTSETVGMSVIAAEAEGLVVWEETFCLRRGNNDIQINGHWCCLLYFYGIKILVISELVSWQEVFSFF